MTRNKITPALMHAAAAAVGVIVCGSAATAQLPSPSTRALGMGDNHTAAARGYAAVAWNPALLALPGAPETSLALLPLRGVAGLAPVGLTDLNEWQGRHIPISVREQWLRDIESKGREAGSAGGDATYVVAKLGRFGIQAASVLRAIGDLTPGAAELLFFGNAGRTGEPRDLAVGGSEIRGHAASTLAVSYAMPVRTSAARTTTAGLTVKYTIGHMLLLGHASGNATATDAAIDLEFPVLRTTTEQINARAGAGVGVDLGFATRSGNMTIGATMQNAVSTFGWDETKLEFRDGLAQFDQSTKTSAFDVRDLATAPADLRQAVSNARFARAVTAGVMLESSARLTLSSDVRLRLNRTTLAESSGFHIGGGAEYRVRPRVLLRAGAAAIAHGYQLGGGVGLGFGPVNVAASLMHRESDFGSAIISMLTLFSTTGE